jgi:lysozyme family protein
MKGFERLSNNCTGKMTSGLLLTIPVGNSPIALATTYAAAALKVLS